MEKDFEANCLAKFQCESMIFTSRVMKGEKID